MSKIGFSVAAIAVLFLGGCDGGGGGEGGGTGGGGGAGGGGGGADTVSFAVRLVDATAKEETPLADVKVCAAERPEIECATSDAEGKLTLALPAKSELMLGCESDSHGPMYMTWTIGAEDIQAGTFSLLAKGTMSQLVSLSGGTEWPEKGAITANVYEDLVKRTTRVAGATFTIAPKSGGGPTYVSAAKLPNKALTESTEGGPALFFDLDPGEVTITIAHPDRECVGGFGWDAGDDKALGSKIFAGGLSNVTFVCPP